MDWPQLLNDLSQRQWTQKLLAEHCGVVQSTISALYTGDTRSPAFALGDALIRLRDSGATPAKEVA